MHKLMDRYRGRRATGKEPHLAHSPRGRDHGSTPATPRWVKVFGVIAVVLVLLVVLMLLFGGGPGDHGPARHLGTA